MYLTAEMLREKGAEVRCTDLKVFKCEWPEGVEITKDVIDRAIELNLHIDWFAWNFLTGALLVEYRRVTNAAVAEYLRVENAAFAKYNRTCSKALWAVLQMKKEE